MFCKPWLAIVSVTIPVVGLYAAFVGVKTAGPLNPWALDVIVRSPLIGSYVAPVAVWSVELTAVIDIDLPPIVRLERQAGGAEAINKAAKLFSDAKFPVILSGAGVVIGGAIDDCVK